jgi:Na+-transporting methylmalonyl-CoA/oxaloacetate decarboxylase gamma subunit
MTMMNTLAIALEITALGMGLVFAAIILLWWMMATLTTVAPEKETTGKEPDSDAALPAPVVNRNARAKAAAIAVAMALAEQQMSQAHPLSLPPTAIVSAWQLGMRTRQMYQKGTPIVRKPRKVG